MSFTTSRISRVKPSATLAIKARAAELKAAGRSICDLSAGEPDIDTPQHIKDAAVQAMQAGHTKYTPVAGIPALRAAIAEKLRNENQLNHASENIVVCNGGKQAIHNCFEVLLEPGDEVILAAPYWVSYPEEIYLAGGTSVIVPTTEESGYKMQPADLARAMSERTKVVVINSPSNPTGAAYSSSELQELGKVIASSNALVLSDEVYEKLVYDSFEHVSFGAACPELAARTITIGAFSKTYSMTGWRVGYAAASKEIIDAINNYQSHTTSNVCSIAQYAALGALQGPHDFLEVLRENYYRRMVFCQRELKGITGLSLSHIPEGAFYLFVDIKDLLSQHADKLRGSADFCAYLIEQSGVAVVPGIEFGDDSGFRMSVSSNDQNLRSGLDLIRQAVQAL